MSATSPLSEETELNEACESSTGVSAPRSSEGSSAVTSIPKVKSADTNVRVSMKIVNEVESVKTSVVNPSCLDIVEEELAKMAVAESLNDIPTVGGAGEAALAIAGNLANIFF